MGDMPRWEKLLEDVRKGKYKKFVKGGKKMASCANNLTSKKSEGEMNENEQ